MGCFATTGSKLLILWCARRDSNSRSTTGVHGAYEEKMVDQNAAELQQMFDAFDVERLGPKLKEPANGYEAGLAAIELIRRTHKTLPPADICNLYGSLGGRPAQAFTAAMWQKLSSQTVTCLVDGAARSRRSGTRRTRWRATATSAGPSRRTGSQAFT
jgi:hypothetical protein